MAALVAALEATGTEFTDYKLMTTPQLHYVTRCINTKGTQKEYGEPTEDGYYKKLAAAFKAANKGKNFNGGITVDCANGVGGPKLVQFLKYLDSPADGGLEIKVVNDDVLQPDRLNHQVCSYLVPFPSGTELLTPCSAAPTMSKRTSEPLPPQLPANSAGAAPSTAMPTA